MTVMSASPPKICTTKQGHEKAMCATNRHGKPTVATSQGAPRAPRGSRGSKGLIGPTETPKGPKGLQGPQGLQGAHGAHGAHWAHGAHGRRRAGGGRTAGMGHITTKCAGPNWLQWIYHGEPTVASSRAKWLRWVCRGKPTLAAGMPSSRGGRSEAQHNPPHCACTILTVCRARGRFTILLNYIVCCKAT